MKYILLTVLLAITIYAAVPTMPTNTPFATTVTMIGTTNLVPVSAEALIKSWVVGDTNDTAQVLTIVSNQFLRVIEVSPGVWEHRLPGEE